MPLLLWIQPAPAPETQRIDTLIKSIEALQGQAVFIRNGAEHDAKAAGEHLRLKWRKAGDRVKSAADFIRYCATSSSTSGQPYKIRYKDGHEVTSADFLWTALKQLDPAVK